MGWYFFSSGDLESGGGSYYAPTVIKVQFYISKKFELVQKLVFSQNQFPLLYRPNGDKQTTSATMNEIG